MIGDAAQHIGEPGLGIDAVEFCRGDQGVDRGGTLTAAVGAGEQPRAASERNRPVILPMSGGKLKFITGGTRCISVAFAASTLSGALAVKSFTLRWRPAWLSWWRPGCWIPPPAPEWSWVRRALQCRRWLSCISY